MAIVYMCPYYRKSQSGKVICEGCRLGFKDARERKEYIERHCCDIEGWRRCTVARSRNRYYEREG